MKERKVLKRNKLFNEQRANTFSAAAVFFSTDTGGRFSEHNSLYHIKK
jgi:hypothetical protein